MANPPELPKLKPIQLNPFVWKGETLNQTITRHLKDPRTTLAARAPMPVAQAPAATPFLKVSPEELMWAQQLEVRVKGNQQISPEEAQKYTDIFNRYQQQQAVSPEGR